jgi:hypothetical protein
MLELYGRTELKLSDVTDQRQADSSSNQRPATKQQQAAELP